MIVPDILVTAGVTWGMWQAMGARYGSSQPLVMRLVPVAVMGAFGFAICLGFAGSWYGPLAAAVGGLVCIDRVWHGPSA